MTSIATCPTRPAEPLSAVQQQLVRENVGLIGVHLKRNVPDLADPRCDREWDDLFQEGCVGLVQAARAYPDDARIPFAAFAMPRIARAVRNALDTQFDLIRVPPEKQRAASKRRERDDARTAIHKLKQHPFHEDLVYRQRRRRHRDPTLSPAETVGERLLDKYKRAVHEVVETSKAGSASSGGRSRVMRVLAEERHLIPRPEHQTSLREIGDRAGASFGCVSGCDEQMREKVRQILRDDPEVEELHDRARHDPMGTDLPVDRELDGALAGAFVRGFVQRFRRADAPQKGVMIEVLIAAGRLDVTELAARSLSPLTAEQREEVLRAVRRALRPRPSTETFRRRGTVPARRRKALVNRKMRYATRRKKVPARRKNPCYFGVMRSRTLSAKP